MQIEGNKYIQNMSKIDIAINQWKAKNKSDDIPIQIEANIINKYMTKKQLAITVVALMRENKN